MAEDLPTDGATDADAEERFHAALAAAEASPEDDDRWDLAEELAEQLQRPDPVGEAYRRVLAQDLSRELAQSLGQRASGFHEEWFAEDSPHLVEVLKRVLELDPEADWALQRLTVVMTVGERWAELLGLYDRSLAAAEDDGRREQLLEEAASLAKDFAGEPDRAIGYLTQLLELRPKDKQLVSSLERLLERQGRWEELIGLWRRRIEGLKKKNEKLELRGRIAACYLDNLEDAESTLAEVTALLEAGAEEDSNLALLERVVALEAATASVRRGALDLLRERYSAAERQEDIVRALGVALGFAEGDERVALHRELGERLSAGAPAEAMTHWAAVLALAPGAEDAQEQLAHLAQVADAHDRYADALVAAADAAEPGPRQYALLVEAADVRGGQLADRATAIALYQRVLAADARGATKLTVARRLEALLEESERYAERLAVLEGLAQLESDPVERRRVLGQCARLAERLDEGERALGLWQQRLEGDASDLEALDAMIELTERVERWDLHVDALRRRVEADVPALQRRLDLARIAGAHANKLAQIDEAIATWHRIQEEFGEDQETVDALFDLSIQAGRFDEIYELLGRAAGRDAARAAEVLARVGDVCREHLGRHDEAAKAYHRAIVMEPGLERAQVGLTSLLDNPEARGSAVRGLAKAYELADDWQKTIDLMEPRIELALGDDERVEVLREAAQLHEHRAGAPEAALDANRRALGFDPGHRELEAEVLRLAEVTGRWADAAESIGDAASVLSSVRRPRAAELRRRQAILCEQHLDDASGALDCWLAALDLEPHDATTASETIRVGADAARWDGAARAVVDASVARGAVQEDLLTSLEARAEDAGAFAALAAGLADAIPGPGQIESAIGRALEGRVASWLAHHVEDPEGAEAALRRALGHETGHTDTLRELARLQWRTPGRALVDTLLSLAGHFPDDLDPLYDAARIALDPVGDVELAGGILDRLLRSARRLWEGGTDAGGERPADATAVWALDELVRLATEANDARRAVDLLVDGARLPVTPERSRDMRRRAGALCREQLGDQERALRLLQSVVDESVDDAEAVSQLGVLLEERGQLPQLLALRQRQLTLELAPDTRLSVRLEVARVLGLIEAQGGRVGVLRQNLEEHPGHEASVEGLATILAEQSRGAELAQLYTTQATAVEAAGETARAANLWARAAARLEDDLSDVDGALKAHRRVVALESSAASLDALARLHMERNEPGVAAEWLSRRLEQSGDDERGAIALRLAEAHLSAGEEGQATKVLERVLASDMTASSARTRLAGLYRDAESWEPLAKLLADGAPHEPEVQTRLAYVREAAQLYEQRLDSPDQAIPVLQMGVELEPDDAELKSKLALGLRVAGRLDEARAILEGLAQSYGRRRSPERAQVHYQLAQVAHAGGDLEDAMLQLEQARKMDMSHPGILRMAGQMAREAGQLERAEKAYRALLLVVRRQDASAEDLSVGSSEVLYELSLLSTAGDDEEQAAELLETALSTAAQHDPEAERLYRDLVGRGESELALSVIDRRLAAVSAPESKARMLAHRADVLAKHLDRSEEALAALLDAIELAPEQSSLHDGCRALAKSMGAVERYAETLRSLAEKSRRKEEAAFAAALLLRLGEVTESDLGDLDAATELYQRVEATGIEVVNAWLALARVADARGDSAEEVRVLRKLVDAESGVPSEARTKALYRIAEVELAAGQVEGGLETLGGALQREPRYARAGAILQAAASQAPGHEDLLRVYEEVARASGDPSMVLDFLERRVGTASASLDHVREGVERADAVEAPERAEALLRRGMQLAQDSELGLRDALWVPVGLAERRKAAGDIPEAMQWTQSAAELADGDEQFQLWMQLADLAAMEGGDLAVAAQTYRSLLASDPSNRQLWEPLAGVYAKLEDRDGLEEVVRTTLDALLDPADRNELRMFYASFLLDVASARDDAVKVLKDVLDEDPDHADAGQRLADLFDASGDRRELVDLLQRQLDRARDRQDVATIVSLSLRMGKLVEAEDDAAAAVDFYRGGLDWAPESRDLLAALLGHYGEGAEPRDRAELMERLLAVSSGEAGASLARELMILWQSLDDEYGAARALDLGFKACPSDAGLRDKLETYYLEREEWTELAAMIAFDAANREDPEEAVARTREAAALYRDTLQSPGQAAEAIRSAWARRPEDLGLLEELVSDLAQAGLHSAAAADVAAALEHHEEATAQRAHLLRMRARLELAIGNTDPAVRDLEEAYAIDAPASAQDLVAGLDAQRHAAAAARDGDAERAATHRLAAVLTEAGNPDGGRDVLAEWVERVPNDRDALRMLRAVDTAADRWEDVARHNARLVEVEEGEDQVVAALGLADACRRIEQPEAARPGLELAQQTQPSEPRLREALKALYEAIGANRELAALVLIDAHAAEDPEARFEAFRRAGDLLITVGDAESALDPLAQAAMIKPDDHDLTILLADAYMGSGRLQETVELLQEAINGFKRRRSPHLSAMQLRMARIAGISGDAETQKEWLSVALDADKNNGEVAAELAELAMELGDDDTALKALRVVTLQKTPGPMSKALAFLRQAQIAYRQGDHQKAVLWARRARLEDDSLDEAQTFLEQIGES